MTVKTNPAYNVNSVKGYMIPKFELKKFKNEWGSSLNWCALKNSDLDWAEGDALKLSKTPKRKGANKIIDNANGVEIFKIRLILILSFESIWIIEYIVINDKKSIAAARGIYPPNIEKIIGKAVYTMVLKLG